jgi:cation transport regulator ChaC
MKLFGEEPQEKAMSTLIHDTNSALGSFHLHIKEIRENLKDLGIKDSDILIHLEYLNSLEYNIKKAVDAYYEKFKKDFNHN